MNNGSTTKSFLAATDINTRTQVLNNIASHYGISADEAFEEVTDPDAEHLLDYVTGPERAALHVLMIRSGY